MKKTLSVLFILLALMAFVSCASGAKAVEAEPKSEPEVTAEAAKEDFPAFQYEVYVPETDKQFMAVILEEVEGYTWNPQYMSYEDLDVLYFMENDIQEERSSADGKMYIVFKFQAITATPELTFNCLLKKDGVPLAGVEVRIAIDSNHDITVLSAGAGPVVSAN